MLTNGFTFLLKGGVVMWPLFICAIVSVTIIVERYVALRGVLKNADGLRKQAHLSLASGRTRAALSIAEARGGPIGRVIQTVLTNSAMQREDIEHLISEMSMEETPQLTRGLTALDTIITIAPLLGLLGTVTGMIAAFQVVQMAQGLGAPAAITGGVAEALIATATGLAIAIVTLVGYNYLSDLVKKVVAEMEITATQIINDISLRLPQAQSTNQTQPEPKYEAAIR